MSVFSPFLPVYFLAQRGRKFFTETARPNRHEKPANKWRKGKYGVRSNQALTPYIRQRIAFSW
jgi:hypothetical protein